AVRPEVQVVVAATGRARYPGAGAIRLHGGDPLAVFAAADAGLCKSGTTTLEAALADVPMAIAYRLNPVSFAIAIRVLQVPHVGLVNLIAEREVAPEFLQGAVTPAALADAVLPLLDPASEAARRQREGLALVRERLGPPGAAERVAALAAEPAGGRRSSQRGGDVGLLGLVRHLRQGGEVALTPTGRAARRSG